MKKTSNNSQIDIVNYTLLFKDISELILNKGDLSNTASNILNLISKKVESLFYILLLIDDDNNLVLQSFTTEYLKKMTKIIPFDIFKIKYPLTAEKALIIQCVKKNKIVQSKKLRDFFSPVFKPAIILDTIQNSIGAKLCVGIPIKHGNKVTGAIAFATKKDNLNKEEINMLELYANLSGIAINNNLQFERIQKQYEFEKETTSILSHELKTPIAIAHHSAQTILMMLEKYKEQMDNKTLGELVKTANDIQHGMDRLTKICTSIFNLREVENKVPEDIHFIDLKKQLNQIIFTYERKAYQKGLVFEYHIDECKQKYYGGIIQLEQIITILLDNAVKYTEKGSISLTTQFKKKNLICKVIDTGCGIPPKKRQLVFKKFYRNVKNGKKMNKTDGLGLGLYIAEKIIKEINGSIDITDNPKGSGTCIIAKIPMYLSKKPTEKHRKKINKKWWGK